MTEFLPGHVYRALNSDSVFRVEHLLANCYDRLMLNQGLEG
jgi:hypothetical protein